MRAFKDSGIEWLGEIPQHWEVVKGFFLFVNKKELNSNFQCKTRLALTLNGVIEKDIGQNFGLNPLDFRTYQIFNYDDLVFKLIDLDNINTSRVGYVYKKGIMSSAYIRLIPKEKSCSKYFYYFYYSLYVKQIFNNIGTGVRSTLNADELLSIKIPLPPLEEQKAIADFLDSKCTQIDNFCEKKQKLITLLNEKKQSLINECVTKGLDTNVTFKDSGIEWLGEIPQHWEIKKLKYIGEIFGGVTGKTIKDFSKEYKPNFKPYITFTNVCNNAIINPNSMEYVFIDFDEKQNKVLKNDILFLQSSETFEDVGKSAIYLNDDEVYLNTFCKGFRIEREAYPMYLNYLLSSLSYKRYFMSVCSGFTRINLRQEHFLDIPLILPLLQEQEQIADFLDSKISKIDKIIEKTKKQIKLIKEYKNTLINQAICGRINL